MGKDQLCDGRKHMWASDQRSAEEHLRVWTLGGKVAGALKASVTCALTVPCVREARSAYLRAKMQQA
jgi:hypothetical protein